MTTTDRPKAKADGSSPGDIEVVWSRLLSIMDEAAATMIRTAYSITIRESKDLAVVVFDRKGRALAESAIASPSFIGTLPRTLDAFLAEYPAADWREGDLVITNDPWIGSGHLQDITMAAPILAGRILVGFVAISAHGPDIGGALYSALSREIFEEGLRIPVTRYARGGHRDPPRQALHHEQRAGAGQGHRGSRGDGGLLPGARAGRSSSSPASTGRSATSGSRARSWPARRGPFAPPSRRRRGAPGRAR